MKKVVAAIGGLFLLTGCTSVSTEPDQRAVHYEGGSFSSKKYASYVDSSKKEWFGPGDKVYIYPKGQRSYDATGGAGAEHAPFTSSSKDSVELATPMSVTFELKTDEQSLRTFHEQIGIKYHAYTEDGDNADVSEGWGRVLDFYMGQSLDATVDRVLAGYDWRQAYNDPAIRLLIQNEVQKDLPILVKSKMQNDYFTNYAVQVQRPVPTSTELRENIAKAQTQVADSEAAKAKAEADLKKTQAQVAVAQAEAAKKKADISAYGSVDQYNKAQAIEKGINPYQPTYIVSGTAPANR